MARAAYTVFIIPKHDSIYEEVAKQLRKKPQPCHPLLAQEIARIQEVDVDVRHLPRLRSKELLGLAGILMQFASYLPKLRPYCLTPFADTEALYTAFVAQGKNKPLDFSEQLEIALRQTSGDLPEALWRLFITSWLYARWFDVDVIVGIPAFSKKEAMHRMSEWSRSLAACKSYGSVPDQDTSGDTYYCWTHALAKVAYWALPIRRTIAIRIAAFILQNGTHLNHKLAHRFKPQTLPSDHMVAAAYGNSIGEVCVGLLRQQKSDQSLAGTEYCIMDNYMNDRYILHKLYQFSGKIVYYCALPALYIYGKMADSPRVRLFILHKNRVFLVRNWLGHQKWTLPGGGLEHGESEISGLQREVKEELGVILLEEKFYHLATFTLADRWAPYEISVYIYNSDLPHPITHDKREIIDARWFSLNNLPPGISPEFIEVFARYRNHNG